MRFGARDWLNDKAEDRPVTTRACDCPGCEGVGLYPAPKSRDRLRDYYWFCLEHVRAYNTAWDYCAGMSEAQIEDQIRWATVWERPTHPMGTSAQKTAGGFQADNLRAKIWETFFNDESNDSGARRKNSDGGGQSSAMRAEMDALASLDLKLPVTFAEIKLRYRALVKQFHPDANGGSAKAEDRLKQINHAFTVLKAWFGK